MIVGSYEIQLDGKKAEKVSIKNDFMVGKGPSKIEWLSTGEVRIRCDTLQALYLLKIIAELAMRRGSVQRDRASPAGYRRFTIRELSLTENGRPMAKGQSIITDATAYFEDFSSEICKKSATDLLETEMDFESLLFLMRATDLIEERTELSLLSAFSTLEIALAKVLPGDGELGFFDRIKILEFLKVMDTTKLTLLNRLRNQLAHGTWRNPKVGDYLNNLLQGGASKWIGPDNRMNKEAGRRVLEDIMEAMVIVTKRTNVIQETLKQISNTEKANSPV